MPARVLVDITHPAHFHFFRPAMEIWQQDGVEVFVGARDKDLTLNLLDTYGYEYEILSKARRGLAGLGREMIEHESRLFRMIRRVRPAVVLEVAGTFIVHAAALARIPSLVFYDTEAARFSNAITYPFATKVITPECYQGNVGRKHTRYAGYQELAYLHPRYFTPDRAVLSVLGVSEDEPYYVVRFVNWQASHDIHERGFSLDDKMELVRRLRQYGRIFITSEGELPAELRSYRLRVSPQLIHHVLAFAHLYVGESATMASESAILGTPSLYVSSAFRGYITEQEERYELSYWCVDPQEALARAEVLASDSLAKHEWARRRQQMLAEKEDVTEVIHHAVGPYLLQGIPSTNTASQ